MYFNKNNTIMLLLRMCKTVVIIIKLNEYDSRPMLLYLI